MLTMILYTFSFLLLSIFVLVTMQPSSRLSTRCFFNRAILADLYEWWHIGVPNRPDVPISQDVLLRWYRPSTELDEQCWSVRYHFQS